MKQDNVNIAILAIEYMMNNVFHKKVPRLTVYHKYNIAIVNNVLEDSPKLFWILENVNVSRDISLKIMLV